MERIQYEGGPWHGQIDHRDIDPTDLGRYAFHPDPQRSGYYRISDKMPAGPDADWVAWWIPARTVS